MSVEITPLTELEAVNAILGSIGESPIDSLTDPLPDATFALNTLRRVSAETQVKGWSFNTELDYDLTPTAGGEIYVPSNVLKFIYTDDSNIVQRGNRLYDRNAHSYTEFTTSITATLVVGLPFEELPEALRQFLTISAGRIFQDRMGGDGLEHQFQERDALTAWATFLNYEADVGTYNVLDSSQLVSRIKGRR